MTCSLGRGAPPSSALTRPHASSTIGTYTEEEASNLEAKFAQTITADAYPYLHEHAQQHFSEGPHRGVSAFELGLDLIVEGLKKIHDTA